MQSGSGGRVRVVRLGQGYMSAVDVDMCGTVGGVVDRSGEVVEGRKWGRRR